MNEEPNIFPSFGILVFNAGVSEVMDEYTSVPGQPRDVELAVGGMGKAVPRTAVLSEGLDPGPQPS